MGPVVRFTYKEYRQLSDADTKRYELLLGELFMVPSPETAHQRAVRNLSLSLWRFVQEHDLGELLFTPLDVVLSEYVVVQPDVLYVAKERLHIIMPEGVRGTPDLVVEVLSPSTRERDLVTKRILYSRSGVKEYWLVYPEQRVVEVFRLAGTELSPVAAYAEADALDSPLLPGLSLPVREIFR